MMHPALGEEVGGMIDGADRWDKLAFWIGSL